MLPPEIFRRLCAVAYAEAGIRLAAGKETLVESRIARRIQALGLPDAAAYADCLEAKSSGEIVRFLDVISTNYTSFFREPDHFDFLATEAQLWRDAGQPRVRVWCAASSSGEEPYSLAITLAGVFGEEVDWRLLGTDISTRMLEAAKAGRYPEERLRGVQAGIRNRFFTREKDDEGGVVYTFSGPARARIGFGRLNLAESPYPLRGPLDAIFCRNVMIYFDAAMRQGVVHEVERLLRPGGLFFIGHAETLNGLNTSLRLIRPSVFRKEP